MKLLETRMTQSWADNMKQLDVTDAYCHTVVNYSVYWDGWIDSETRLRAEVSKSSETQEAWLYLVSVFSAKRQLHVLLLQWQSWIHDKHSVVYPSSGFFIILSEPQKKTIYLGII